MTPDLVFEVSDFVAIFNQTIEYAYPHVSIVGELANLKVSKGKWVYFDVKDEQSSVRFFGTVYHLPGPLEDGMRVQVRGTPRLHPQFGFSISVQQIVPVGEGTIKRAAELLRRQLQHEGLFDAARKRPLPYPPQRVGLVTSSESAAYADFMKILNHRWRGVEVVLADVQVQGEQAPPQIVDALSSLNAEPHVDVIVVIRGGGSTDDLRAFSDERVVRAVAASRIPSLVAIGHEIDESLAELVADRRASTPSTAAELLVPDKASTLAAIATEENTMKMRLTHLVAAQQEALANKRLFLQQHALQVLAQHQATLELKRQILSGYDPRRILSAGYAALSQAGKRIISVDELSVGSTAQLRLADGQASAMVTEVRKV